MDKSLYELVRRDIVDVLRQAIYYGHGRVVSNRRKRLSELNALHPTLAAAHAEEDRRLMDCEIGRPRTVSEDRPIGLSRTPSPCHARA